MDCHSYTWDYTLLSLCSQDRNGKSRIVLVIWEQCAVICIPLWTAAFAQNKHSPKKLRRCSQAQSPILWKAVDLSNYRLNPGSFFFFLISDRTQCSRFASSCFFAQRWQTGVFLSCWHISPASQCFACACVWYTYYMQSCFFSSSLSSG